MASAACSQASGTCMQWGRAAFVCWKMYRLQQELKTIMSDSHRGHVVPDTCTRVLKYWFLTWGKGCRETKDRRIFDTGTGIYGYEIGEISIISIMNVDGDQLPADEFCVVKIGMTNTLKGGFSKRIDSELNEIRDKWRGGSIVTGAERSMFLISERGASSFEQTVIATLGTNIGRWSVDKKKSETAISAICNSKGSLTADMVITKNSGRLKVKDGWGTWLVGKNGQTRVGPSEFVVVPKKLLKVLYDSYRAHPGKLSVEILKEAVLKFNMPQVKEVHIDLTHKQSSIGPLVLKR